MVYPERTRFNRIGSHLEQVDVEAIIAGKDEGFEDDAGDHVEEDDGARSTHIIGGDETDNGGIAVVAGEDNVARKNDVRRPHSVSMSTGQVGDHQLITNADRIAIRVPTNSMNNSGRSQDMATRTTTIVVCDRGSVRYLQLIISPQHGNWSPVIGCG